MGRVGGPSRQPVAVGAALIRITAKKDGFRRAGMTHAGTREYPDGAFTAEALAALKAEPMLVIEEIPDAGEPKPTTRKKD